MGSDVVKVAIHQPHYLPWLGYFAKMDEADVFIFLDTVQFEKHGWQNRNRIKTSQGWQWLTVPVSARFPALLSEVAVDNGQGWARKHVQALHTHYAKAPAFQQEFDGLAEVLGRPWDALVELNCSLTLYLASRLGLDKKIVRASTLPARDTPTDRLMDLCRAVGGTVYLAGNDGTRYMDLERCAAAGIEVWRQEYRHPLYRQLYGDFIPSMAVVDLLFNEGDASLAVLRSGHGWSRSEPGP